MQDIIKPIDRALLKAELTGDKKLRRTNKSNNEIYIITAHDSPNVMQEIGRLREIAFRYYGGGTGFPVDIDEYDTMATQMLHSMISNPRPTRAEVTDIANAIYYRTDALMLSGETAYGKYPVEAVQTMTKVAREAEKTKLAANDIRVPIEGNDLDVTSFLAKQAVKSSSKLHVKAIITDSYTGRTARYLAAFRGTSTVFSICYNPRVMRMLSLSYGVWAVHQPYNDSRRGYFYDALNELIKSGRITRNDMVAYLSGSFGEGGGTSFLEINNVGKVLDAGSNYQLPTFKE